MSEKKIKIGKWKTVFKGIFTTIKQAEARYPNGCVKTWEKNFRIPSVILLAFDKKGRFLLIREFKSNRQKYEWRVPGGKVDCPELTVKQQAQKELREETGFSAGRLKKILVWQSGGWDLYVYLATNLKNDPLENDEYEDIKVYFLPLSKVYQMCLDGKIKSSHIMASIIFLYHQIKSGKIKL